MCIVIQLCAEKIVCVGTVNTSQVDCMVALNKFLNLEEVQSGPVGETISSNGRGKGVGSLDALGHVV